MERRANAILNGRKRSTILSTAASTKPKSNETTSDVKKNRYTFTLLKKASSKQDSESKLCQDVKNQQSSDGKNYPTMKQPLVPKARAEVNESPCFTPEAPLDTDLLESSGTISHAGNFYHNIILSKNNKVSVFKVLL